MVELALLFTAAGRASWAVASLVWSGSMALSAFVKIVVAWACWAEVSVSRVVNRATLLATMVAGSGAEPLVSTPKGLCPIKVAASRAVHAVSFVRVFIEVVPSPCVGMVSATRRNGNHPPRAVSLDSRSPAAPNGELPGGHAHGP